MAHSRKITIRNECLRVSVLPELGGRIISLKNSPRGRNCIFDRLDDERDPMNAGLKFISRMGKAKDVSEGCRVLSRNLGFQLQRVEKSVVRENKESISLLMKVTIYPIKQTVRLTLRRDSDALEVYHTVTNISDKRIDVQGQMHGVWALGGKPDVNDIIMIPLKDGTERIYYNGTKCHRYFIPAENWALLASIKKKEVVIVEADSKLYFFYVFANRTIYNLEIFSRIASLGKGQKHRYGFKIRVVSGLPIIDGLGAARRVLRGAGTDKDIYRQGETIRFCACEAGRNSAKGSILNMQMSHGKSGIVQSKDIRMKRISTSKGKAWLAECNVPTRYLSDGSYMIRTFFPGRKESRISIRMVGDFLDSSVKKLSEYISFTRGMGVSRCYPVDLLDPAVRGVIALVDMGLFRGPARNRGCVTADRIGSLEKALAQIRHARNIQLDRKGKFCWEKNTALRDMARFKGAKNLRGRFPSIFKDREVLFGDIHVHSWYSDGTSAPLSLILAAIESGLDFIAITDHNCVDGAIDGAKYLNQLRIDFPLIIGQEVSSRELHMIGLGNKNAISWKKSPPEMIEEIHKGVGLSVLAHPGNNPDGTPVSEWARRLISHPDDYGLDGFEISELIKTRISSQTGEGMKPLVFGSDTHLPVYDRHAYTIVFARDRSPESILEAIKERYSLVYLDGQLFGRQCLKEKFHMVLKNRRFWKNKQEADSKRAFQNIVSICTQLLT